MTKSYGMRNKAKVKKHSLGVGHEDKKKKKDKRISAECRDFFSIRDLTRFREGKRAEVELPCPVPLRLLLLAPQTPSHTLMDTGAEESPEVEQEEGVKRKGRCGKLLKKRGRRKGFWPWCGHIMPERLGMCPTTITCSHSQGSPCRVHVETKET